ncbi:MAG: hypothetical protein ACI8QD_000608 [Cyclobacteriaceae bacterium]|jgi:hypothetical protein
MKKLTLIALSLVTLLAFKPEANGQEFPAVDGSPMDMAYFPPRVAFRAFAKTDVEKSVVPQIRVIYSRPQAKDRKVFTDLEKPGNMWRVGANEATEILFYQDVTIGDKTVKAGRYTIYAMLGESEWTIHFSNDLDRWGHYAFKPEESSLASITVPTAKTAETVESMSILFEAADPGAHMIIAWDDTMVRVPIGL